MTARTINRPGARTRSVAVETKATTTARLAYVDNLRIVLVILVLLHHLAITYGAEGSWYYRDGQSDLIVSTVLTLFVAINQAFFMGFYFLIAGYFTPRSYDRKGRGQFIKDRLVRLGVPLLLQLIVISPLLSFALASRVGGFQGSLGQYLGIYLENLDSLHVGPLWFVEALLIFSAAYVLWRLWVKPATDRFESGGAIPGNLAIGVFAFLVGLITFVVRIWLPVGWSFELLGLQFPHFPQYISMFIIGIVAYRRGWLEAIPDAAGKRWSRIVVALIVSSPILYASGGALEGEVTPFRGGVHWQAFAYALWEQFLCVGIVISSLVWFRKRRDRQGTLAKAMSASAYTVYILHSLVCVLVALALRDINMYPLVKFALAMLISLSLGFSLGNWIRKLPLARIVL